MTPLTSQKGLKLAVIGLGGSGLSTCEALKAGGCEVVAWDDNEMARARARKAGFTVTDLQDDDFRSFNGLILAPGIPYYFPEPHWAVKKVRPMGMPVFGDIELFSREREAIAPHAPLVAITGTNGKSTTTALIAHILRASGRDTQMGGNIGTPVLMLEPPADNRFHVIECSSFQLDLSPNIKPTVGILLNVTPDHLDRHGSMNAYSSAKLRLIENVAETDTKVIGIDDEYGLKYCQYFSNRGDKVEAVSVKTAVYSGYFYNGSAILRMQGGQEAFRFSLEEIGSLRGAHNAQNAMAAHAACSALGLSHDEIMSGMRSFPGLAHRMEQVGRRKNVLFVNDSKATNADSAEKALLSFGDIFWIAGGKPKEGGIDSLMGLLGPVRKVYLIGEASDLFSATLGAHPHEMMGTLEAAVAKAAEEAAIFGGPDAVVLLSPACASYDQFPNFEVRGNVFRDLVLALDGIEPMKG